MIIKADAALVGCCCCVLLSCEETRENGVVVS